MPLTYLDAVNSVLKRTGVIQGDQGELSTTTGATASEIFVSSSIQHSIDLVLQMWQEASDELYSLALVPNLVSTATITLVDAQREYDLPADFERVAGDSSTVRVMRGATKGRVLQEYPGGYLRMLADQRIATGWVGDPLSWAISPQDGAIRLDRDPNSDNAGHTYNIAYEKRIDLTVTMATETMPFSDTVTRSFVPVVAEFFNRTKKEDFDQGIFRNSLVRAFTMSRTEPPKVRYGQRRSYRTGLNRRGR